MARLGVPAPTISPVFVSCRDTTCGADSSWQMANGMYIYMCVCVCRIILDSSNLGFIDILRSYTYNQHTVYTQIHIYIYIYDQLIAREPSWEYSSDNWAGSLDASHV